MHYAAVHPYDKLRRIVWCNFYHAKGHDDQRQSERHSDNVPREWFVVNVCRRIEPYHADDLDDIREQWNRGDSDRCRRTARSCGRR